MTDIDRKSLADATEILQEWRTAKVTDAWIDGFCERVDNFLATQTATELMTKGLVSGLVEERDRAETALAEARVCTEADRAVLDAMSKVKLEGEDLAWLEKNASEDLWPAMLAELARRKTTWRST